MKKSYYKLLAYESVLLFVLILNSFMPSILNNYKIILFLVVLIILFKFLFGLEKDRNRFVKDIILEMLIIYLVALSLYYISGLLIGFTRTTNYYSWFGLKNIIIPIILTIILKEYLRYNIIKKSEESKILIWISCVLFIFLDISGVFTLQYFSSSYRIFTFIALYVLPSISNNILCTYLTKRVGYKPCIVFLLIARLYYYILPLVPSTGEYIESIIALLFPIFLLFRFHFLFNREDDNYVERDYRKTNYASLVFLVILTSFLVYFSSGLFHYYVVSIGSGSMMPAISTGDAVLIEKVEDDYEFQVGDIIAYKYDQTLVVHRLNKIENDKDEYFYFTKGDANKDMDALTVKRDMIAGVIRGKIPYIGLPAVWLNNL